MAETVAVIIASYGDRSFWDLLAQRAIVSVESQFHPPDKLVRIHGASLQEARNDGAAQADTDWLCFLDCDDELEASYLQAMMERPPANELRYPRVRYISEHLTGSRFWPEPTVPPAKPLKQGNYMVIGTLVRRATFMAAGGFADYEAYEDWALWLRCVATGARPVFVWGSVYRAHRRKDSRNFVKNPAALCRRILDDLAASENQRVERVAGNQSDIRVGPG